MKRKFAVAGAVLALGIGLALAAPAALAQEGDTGPGTSACTEAGKAATKATKARDEAQDKVDLLNAQLVVLENTEPKPFQAIEDKRDEIEKADRKLADKQTLLEASVADQTEACAADDPAPTTTPAPTTEPAPPVIDFVDLDCGDFPRPDGTSAQTVLNQDANDPHKLDANNNGVACEGDGVDVEDPDDNDGVDDDNDIDVDVDVDVPSGGVDTGGGPA
jgi:hypothetical protein